MAGILIEDVVIVMEIVNVIIIIIVVITIYKGSVLELDNSSSFTLDEFVKGLKNIYFTI